jgi:ABC-type glycerol-3-phosphate transport system substrate-binding protein
VNDQTAQQTLTRRRVAATAVPVAAAAGTAAALGACAAPGAETGSPVRGPVTVSFLTNWAGGTRLETLQKALPEFQRQHPHISGEYTQGLIADLRGTTPVLKKLQSSERYLSPPPATMKLLVDAFAYARPMPFHARFTPWFDAIQGAMDPAFNGQQQVPDGMKEATRLGDQALAAPAT